MILDHPTVSNLTKCKMLRFMFHEDDCEIQVTEKNTVVIYLWNVDKIKVWQVVADLLSTNIYAGYGFGSRKKLAYEDANNTLAKMRV
jgi:hypothetical protein